MENYNERVPPNNKPSEVSSGIKNEIQYPFYQHSSEARTV